MMCIRVEDKIFDALITLFADGKPVTQNKVSKISGVPRSTLSSRIALRRVQLQNKKG